MSLPGIPGLCIFGRMKNRDVLTFWGWRRQKLSFSSTLFSLICSRCYFFRKSLRGVIWKFSVKLCAIISLQVDHAIMGKFPTWNIFFTCTRSSHAFRKRVRISPIRQKTFEITTLKQSKLLQFTSDNKWKPDGAFGCGCDSILSSYCPWLCCG